MFGMKSWRNDRASTLVIEQAAEIATAMRLRKNAEDRTEDTRRRMRANLDRVHARWMLALDFLRTMTVERDALADRVAIQEERIKSKESLLLRAEQRVTNAYEARIVIRDRNIHHLEEQVRSNDSQYRLLERERNELRTRVEQAEAAVPAELIEPLNEILELAYRARHSVSDTARRSGDAAAAKIRKFLDGNRMEDQADTA